MRSHLQGLFVLVIVGIVLLGLARCAAPVVGEAFGDDGAIVAKSAELEEVVELSAAEIAANTTLVGEEVAELQANLATLGFDPGPVDGILGAGTKAAIAEAISQYKLSVDSSDRAVLAHTDSLINALAAAAVADTPSNDAGEEPGATDAG